MSGDFTDAEKDQLRELLEYKAEFQEMMVLRGARKLVFNTYRSIIIGTAGLLVGVATTWDQVKAFLKGWLQ